MNIISSIRQKLALHSDVKIYFIACFIIFALHFLLQQGHVLNRPYSIFYLDEEYTIATMFISTIAIVAGFHFLIYSRTVKNQTDRALHTFIGLFFIALALDGYFSIHEALNTYLKETLSDESFIKSVAMTSWLFPLAIAIVIIIGILVVHIKRESNIDAKNSYMLGVSLFLLVLFLEPVGGRFFGYWTYPVFVGIEELSEMFGITFFLNGIMLKHTYEKKSHSE